MSMTTVRLELLRHGPSHNQLLSPLTPYLALCDNHPPETINVSLEHGRFLLMGEDLSEVTNQTRAIEEVSEELTRLLASVRSLQTQLPQQTLNDGVIHVRLVLTAAELAMLPFELAKAPAGYSGAGQWFLRNPNLRICLTRETRRLVPSADKWSWPSRPRILFAVGPDIPDELIKAHLLALRQAVDPWLGWWRQADGGIEAEVKSYITMLEQLSFESLRRINEEHKNSHFTHLHVLAHGAKLPSRHSFDTRFGLHVWNSYGPGTEVIDATRLHSALLGCQPRKPTQFSVITLATCDSAHELGIIFPGASFAHELHEKGYPLIVASQLPLTFEASTVITESFYTHIIGGADPRVALHCARDQVATRISATHDWAGLVAYTSLPEQVDLKVQEAQRNTLRRRGDAAVARLHVTLDELEPAIRKANLPLPGRGSDTPDVAVKAISRCLDRFDAVMAESKRELKMDWLQEDQRASFRRWMFSILLRFADVVALHAPNPPTDWSDSHNNTRLRLAPRGAPTGDMPHLSSYTEPELIALALEYTAPFEKTHAELFELVEWYELTAALDYRKSPITPPRKPRDWKSGAKDARAYVTATFGKNRQNELNLARLELLGMCVPAVSDDEHNRVTQSLVDGVANLGLTTNAAHKVVRSLKRLERWFVGSAASSIAAKASETLVAKGVRTWWGESVPR